jgi:hypothetical protein
MATTMRRPLGTGPELSKRGVPVARVNVTARRLATHVFVDKTVDAMVLSDAVPWSQGVGEVDKRTVNNAPLLADAIPAEPGFRVEENRVDEIACVPGFVPVPSDGSVNTSKLVPESERLSQVILTAELPHSRTLHEALSHEPT